MVSKVLIFAFRSLRSHNGFGRGGLFDGYLDIKDHCSIYIYVKESNFYAV